jgi:tetratricopeptide (TPR) repeat protein
VKALFYTLVLSAIVLGSIALMQRLQVAPTTPPAIQNRQPIASGRPLTLSKLDTGEMEKHSVAELFDTGVEFLEQWHVPEARAVFAKVVELDTTFSRAYVRLAECCAEPLFFDESRIRSYLARAADIPGTDTLLVSGMKDLFLDADYTGAATKFEKIVRMSPDNQDARYFLAKAHVAAGRLREARTVLGVLLEKDESSGRARTLLIECLAESGDLDEAETLAKDLAGLFPGEPFPYVLLARIELLNNRVNDAVEFCANALHLDQRYPAAILQRGYIYAEQDDIPAAQVSFEKLLLFDDPALASAAWEAIAYVDFLSGKFDDAVEAMDEAIRLAQSSGSGQRVSNFVLKLVNVLCELGHGDTAESVLNKWIPSSNTIPYHLGRLRLEILEGNLPEARNALEEMKTQPAWLRPMTQLDIDYNELVALTFIQENKFQNAIALLSEGRISDTSRYYLGFASFQDGDAERASAYFDEVLKSRTRLVFPFHRDPVKFVQSLFYLAETNLAIGNAEKAAEYYNRFLMWWGNASWDLKAVARAREKLETLSKKTSAQ